MPTRPTPANGRDRWPRRRGRDAPGVPSRYTPTRPRPAHNGGAPRHGAHPTLGRRSPTEEAPPTLARRTFRRIGPGTLDPGGRRPARFSRRALSPARIPAVQPSEADIRAPQDALRSREPRMHREVNTRQRGSHRLGPAARRSVAIRSSGDAGGRGASPPGGRHRRRRARRGPTTRAAAPRTSRRVAPGENLAEIGPDGARPHLGGTQRASRPASVERRQERTGVGRSASVPASARPPPLGTRPRPGDLANISSRIFGTPRPAAATRSRGGG